MKKITTDICISNFYTGRSIFITGATGFLGKVLIEKLLRSCPHITEIFLLIRPKKGLTVNDRLKKIMDNKDNYDIAFVNDVYQSTVVSYSELKSGNIISPGPVRIPYYTRQSFKNTTKLLGLMDDFRSGVPRSGYRGVVTFFYNGRRVHLAPSANWSGYDITWS